MQREPITWSNSDRAVYYREDAARFRKMAENDDRPSIRDQLARLAQEYARIADALSTQVKARLSSARYEGGRRAWIEPHNQPSFRGAAQRQAQNPGTQVSGNWISDPTLWAVPE